MEAREKNVWCFVITALPGGLHSSKRPLEILLVGQMTILFIYYISLYVSYILSLCIYTVGHLPLDDLYLSLLIYYIELVFNVYFMQLATTVFRAQTVVYWHFIKQRYRNQIT